MRLRIFNAHAHHDRIVLLEGSDLAERDVFREADEVWDCAAAARQCRRARAWCD